MCGGGGGGGVAPEQVIFFFFLQRFQFKISFCYSVMRGCGGGLSKGNFFTKNQKLEKKKICEVCVCVGGGRGRRGQGEVEVRGGGVGGRLE